MKASPRNSGSPSEPPISALELSVARASEIREKPLKDAEVGGAGRPHRDPLSVKVDRTGQLELCSFTRQLHPLDTNDSLLDDDPNRTLIADLVIEQAEIELADYAVNPQSIEVSELAPHAERATGDRGRHR